MALFDFLGAVFSGQGADAKQAAAAGMRTREAITASLQRGDVPAQAKARLSATRAGSLPWVATLSAAELALTRSHGVRPVASVSATCWMHYGWSWTEGHAQGWSTALRRLRDEAAVAGANAVVDVRLRTVPSGPENSMDFSLVGTAVRVDGLQASADPVVATVSALSFAKLLEADIVPVGIAVGAQYAWLDGWGSNLERRWMGNIEAVELGRFWEDIRRRARDELRRDAASQGNGVLAHVDFGQLLRVERGENQPPRYLGRHILVGTTVDAGRRAALPHEIALAVEIGGGTRAGTAPRHQSYGVRDSEGPI